MILHGKHIVLTVQDLDISGISNEYVRSALRFNRSGRLKTYAHIVDPEDARRKLIFYNSLPERVKLMVKESLCEGLEPEEYLKHQGLVDKKETHNDAIASLISKALNRDYLNFTPKYSQYSLELSLSLARAAAVLQAAIEHTKSSDKKVSKVDFFEALKAMNIPYLQWDNYKYFARKVDEAALNGVETVIKPPREGNANRALLTDFHKYVLLSFYGSPRAYTHAQVYELFLYACEQYGQPALDESTVKNWLAKPAQRTRVAELRYGRKWYVDNVRSYLVRENALYANDLWVMDGTRLNMAVRVGKEIVFMDFFAIIDAFSGIVVGWSIAENESHEMVSDAVAMAIKLHQQLPAELLSDNSSAILHQSTQVMTEKMKKYGVNVRRAKVGNARDKTIERMFNTLQTTAMSWFDNYQGAGIKAQKRTSNRPSPEWIAENRKTAPRYDEFVQQVADLVNLHNEGIIRDKSRIARYKESDKPHAIPFDNYLLQVDLLWLERQVQMKQSLVRLQVNNNNYVYRVWDGEIGLNYNGLKVIAKYDPRNMSSIYLFDAVTNTPLCEAKEAKKVPYAAANRTEADDLEIIKHKSHFDKVDRDRDQMLKDMEEKAKAQAGVDEFTLINDVRVLRKDALNSAESQQMRRYVADEYGLLPTSGAVETESWKDQISYPKPPEDSKSRYKPVDDEEDI
jgi:transposase InsO family protein